MNLLHGQGDGKVHDHGKEIKCTHCGRQLYERRGLLHRLTPISNAFVVHGNCLACSSDSEHSAEEEEKVEEVREGNSKEEVSNAE